MSAAAPIPPAPVPVPVPGQVQTGTFVASQAGPAGSPSPLGQRAVVQLAPSGAQVSLADEDPKLFILAGGAYAEVKLNPAEKIAVEECYTEAIKVIQQLGVRYLALQNENDGHALSQKNIVAINAKAGVVVLNIKGKTHEVELDGKTSEGFFGKINEIVNSHFECTLKCYEYGKGKYPLGDNSLPSGSRALDSFKKEKQDSATWTKTEEPSRLRKFFSSSNAKTRVDSITRSFVKALEDKTTFPNSPANPADEKAVETELNKKMEKVTKLKKAFKTELERQKTEIEGKIASKETEIKNMPDPTDPSKKIVDIINEKQQQIEAKEKEISDNPSAPDKDRKLAELTQLHEDLKKAKANLVQLEKDKSELQQKLDAVTNKLKSVDNLDFAALNAVMFTKFYAKPQTPEEKFNAACLLYNFMVACLAANKPVLPHTLGNIPLVGRLVKKLELDPNGTPDPQDDENFSMLSSILSADERKYCLKVASMLLGEQTSRSVYINFAEKCRASYSGKPYEEEFLDALEKFENPPASTSSAVVSVASGASAIPPPPPALPLTEEDRMKKFAEGYLALAF